MTLILLIHIYTQCVRSVRFCKNQKDWFATIVELSKDRPTKQFLFLIKSKLNNNNQ